MCDHLVNLGFTDEKFPHGTHMCLIYSDEKERESVISKFLESGLNGNEKVAYFAHDSTNEDVQNLIRQNGVEMNNQNFIVTRAKSTYCPSGEFVISTMVKTLGVFYHGSIEEGFNGARITGEMAWALEGIPGSERVMEYESMGDIVLPSNPVTVICQYDARKFDGMTLLNCLKVHPYMIVKGQVVQNPYYLTHEEYMNEARKRE